MKLEQGEADRLSDLGMRHGSTVRILCGGENQTILVAVGDGRIGVNYATAEKIYVH